MTHDLLCHTAEHPGNFTPPVACKGDKVKAVLFGLFDDLSRRDTLFVDIICIYYSCFQYRDSFIKVLFLFRFSRSDFGIEKVDQTNLSKGGSM